MVYTKFSTIVKKVLNWESRVLLVAASIILVLLSGAVSGITRRCYCG